MELNGFWQIFLVGSFGGILAESIKWYSLRENPRLPRYARSPRYWVITILMVLAGGILACLYGVKAINAILAANVGASAPLIISSLATAVPPASRTRGSDMQEPSLLEFLTGR
jgi:heme A synthase